MSTTKPELILNASDETELFYAFKCRGESDTKRKVARFLRELDSQKGKTSDYYWYANISNPDEQDKATTESNAEPAIEPKLTIAIHNEQLRKVMFDRGCEWKQTTSKEYFTKDGEYEPYPVGYIRGPHFSECGSRTPYSYSVQGRDGWLQRSFSHTDVAIEGAKWALDTALSVMT